MKRMLLRWLAAYVAFMRPFQLTLNVLLVVVLSFTTGYERALRGVCWRVAGDGLLVVGAAAYLILMFVPRHPEPTIDGPGPPWDPTPR
jgi:hypothetical protein